MRILLTGCAGFIGYHTAQKLLLNGHTVVGVDNLNEYYSIMLKKSRLEQLGLNTSFIKSNVPIRGNTGFSFIRADISDSKLFETILKDEKFDIICHLAAQAGVRYSIKAPQQYINSNIQGFLNILEYCRTNPSMKLVFASSSSVYGKNTSVPYRESDITDSPVSLYAATKKSDELMAHSYSELYGINAIGLRFFTVYGPWGRPDMAPFLFTDAVLNDRELKLFNYGDMSRDFTYIDDVVEGLYKVLLNAPIDSEVAESRFRIYNIGNSKPVQLEDFISTIERITGRTARKIYLPMQPGDVQSTWADVSLIHEHYNYTPSTSIEKGLKAFIGWYKNYYHTSLIPTNDAL